MCANTALSLRWFAIVLSDGGLCGSFEHMMQKAQYTELQIGFINILPSADRFLTIIALNEALQLFLPRMFFKIGENHLQLSISDCIILTGK